MIFDKDLRLTVSETGKTLKISTEPKLDLEINIVSVRVTFLNAKDIKDLFTTDTISTQLIRQSSQTDKTYFTLNSELPVGNYQVSVLIQNDKGVNNFSIELVDNL
ncbi:MAG: hypothetical protein ACOVSR_01330 [Bacteroidia bacterium]